MKLLALALVALPFAAALSGRKNLRQLRQQVRETQRSHHKRDIDPSLLYPEYNLSIPIDHFQNISTYAPHSNGTFANRYWFDASNYQPGGPVIVLQSGESDGSARLPFLQKGLLQQLAQVTHGIGVVLEHRYYGTSFPTPDLSTENLRFLTTEQALADEAYFAQNIVFPGLEGYDLTSSTTAYLGYGGSYAGAFNAFLRVQYPDVFWGTISSSGVTEAIYDYWQYFEPIAQYGPPDCIAAQQTLIDVIDNILIGKNDSMLTTQLKTAFGLENVTYTNDFVNVLSYPLDYWQSLNWDPALSSPEFYNYCANVSSTSMLYPDTATLAPAAASLISAGGYSANSSLVNQMLNLIGYTNLTQVAPCAEEAETQDECFSGHNVTFYEQDDLSQYSWRSWPYQYCTEWGFLQTGSGVPADQKPLLSRLIDLPYEELICNHAFNITTPPDLSTVNKYGGYNISYPRLAIIGGEWDPWRPATPQAFEQGAANRNSTASEPFYLIPQAVHHWDENGAFPNQTTSTFPPHTIQDVQHFEAQFVQEWMEEWQQSQLRIRGGPNKFMKPMKRTTTFEA